MACVALLNFSNTALWICVASVSNYADTYYNMNVSAICTLLHDKSVTNAGILILGKYHVCGTDSGAQSASYVHVETLRSAIFDSRCRFDGLSKGWLRNALLQRYLTCWVQ